MRKMLRTTKRKMGLESTSDIFLLWLESKNLINVLELECALRKRAEWMALSKSNGNGNGHSLGRTRNVSVLCVHARLIRQQS